MDTDYLEWPGKQSDAIVQFSRITTEYDYTKTNGIKMTEGRDFSPDFPSDSSAALVNQNRRQGDGSKGSNRKSIYFCWYKRQLTIIGRDGGCCPRLAV